MDGHFLLNDLFCFKFVEDYLRAVGNQIECVSGGSVVQGVHRLKDGTLHAYADPRKGGQTDGV
jgi:hypothetical protein